MSDKNSALKINQTSKWQLYAITLKAYDDGSVYTEAVKLTEFADMHKQYMTVVYRGNYNGILEITRTDNWTKALAKWNNRYQYSGTTHTALLTGQSDNTAIHAVQGRNSYRIMLDDAKNGQILLIKPKGIYL